MVKQYGDVRSPKRGRKKSAAQHQRELAAAGIVVTSRSVRNWLNDGMPEVEPSRSEWVNSRTQRQASTIATEDQAASLAACFAGKSYAPQTCPAGAEQIVAQLENGEIASENIDYYSRLGVALRHWKDYQRKELQYQKEKGLLRTKEEIIDVIASHDHAVMTVLNQFPHQLASRFSDEATARMVTELAKEEIDKCRKLIATAIQKAIKGNTDSDGDQQGNEEGDQ